MKAIMISLRLWWFYLVYKGIKTLEIRKTCPKNFKGDVFAYVSKTGWKKDLEKIPEEEREFFKQFVGKVGLKFTLNKVKHFEYETCSCDISGYWLDNGKVFELKGTCLSADELWNYIKGKDGYAWHIDNLVIFDKTKELKEFYVYSHSVAGVGLDGKDKTFEILKPLTKAPQSYCFIRDVL